MDRSAAESLLAAQSLRGDGRHAAPDVLVNLLTAATAPARPYELDGEEAAVVAFRQARRAPVPAPGRRSLLARLLTVKVAAAFALTAVGGVAVAAAGGFTELPGASGFGPRSAVPSDTPSPMPSATGPSTLAPVSAAPAPPVTPAPLPHPSPENLCQILLTDPRNGQAGSEIKGLDPQALAALIALAGGKVAEVWSFCARVLGPGAGQWPTGQPWDRLRSSSTGPQDRRSGLPKPSPFASSNQIDPSSPQAADRGNSPTPTPDPRSAQASPSPGGRR